MCEPKHAPLLLQLVVGALAHPLPLAQRSSAALAAIKGPTRQATPLATTNCGANQLVCTSPVCDVMQAYEADAPVPTSCTDYAVADGDSNYNKVFRSGRRSLAGQQRWQRVAVLRA